MGKHPNPFPLVEGPHDRGAHPHPAHVLDLSARDRLAVGDERKGLEQRPGIAGRPFPEEPGDPPRILFAHLVSESGRHFAQLEPPALAVRGELSNHAPYRIV